MPPIDESGWGAAKEAMTKPFPHTEDSEGWGDDYENERNHFTVYDKSLHSYVLNDEKLKPFIARLLAQREAEVRKQTINEILKEANLNRGDYYLDGFVSEEVIREIAEKYGRIATLTPNDYQSNSQV